PDHLDRDRGERDQPGPRTGPAQRDGGHDVHRGGEGGEQVGQLRLVEPGGDLHGAAGPGRDGEDGVDRDQDLAPGRAGPAGHHVCWRRTTSTAVASAATAATNRCGGVAGTGSPSASSGSGSPGWRVSSSTGTPTEAIA